MGNKWDFYEDQDEDDEKDEEAAQARLFDKKWIGSSGRSQPEALQGEEAGAEVPLRRMQLRLALQIHEMPYMLFWQDRSGLIAKIFGLMVQLY